MIEKTLPIGYARFNKYVLLVSNCLAEAATTKNPAQKLFESKARNHLFMLESLVRIYKKIYSKKTFNALDKEFKFMEDVLGKIDFYDTLYKQNKNKKFKINYSIAINELNKYLIDKKFLSNNAFLKICDTSLKKVDWLPPNKDKSKVKKAIEQEFEKTIHLIKSDEIAFNDMELGVHELRRKLRWISIYTQSLDGLIQLKKMPSTPKLKKYQTKDILNSPFNSLPKNTTKNLIPLQIDSNIFYALSWIILELGKIKDEGLSIVENGKIADKKNLAKLLLEAETKTSQFINDIDYKNWFVK